MAWYVIDKKVFDLLTPEQIGLRLWTTYKLLDEQVIGINAGSTASTSVSDGKGNIITATLADAVTFAVAYSKTGEILGLIRLNRVTHKPSDPSEEQRVIASGGKVANARVNDEIAVSRAIGDHEYWSEITQIKYVSSDAGIEVTNKTKIARDLQIDQGSIAKIQIISTCDGFTDGAILDNQDKKGHEAYLKQCLERLQALPSAYSEKEIAKFLAMEAISNGSRDNVSVAVQTLDFDNMPALLLGIYDGHAGARVSHEVTDLFGQKMQPLFPH